MKRLILLSIFLSGAILRAFEIFALKSDKIAKNDVSKLILENSKDLEIEAKRGEIDDLIYFAKSNRLNVQKKLKIENATYFCPISKLVIKKPNQKTKRDLEAIIFPILRKLNLKEEDVVVVPMDCTDTPNDPGCFSAHVKVEHDKHVHFIAFGHSDIKDSDCEFFVACHEVGHLAAGHTEHKFTDDSKLSKLEEQEADTLGASVSSKSAWGGIKFMIDSFLDGERSSETHPMPLERLIYLIEMYKKVAELEVLEGKLDKKDIIQQDQMLLKFMQERGIKNFNQKWTFEHAEFFKHISNNAKQYFKN